MMTVKEQLAAKVAAKMVASPRLSKAAATQAVFKMNPKLREQLVAEANQR